MQTQSLDKFEQDILNAENEFVKTSNNIALEEAKRKAFLEEVNEKVTETHKQYGYACKSKKFNGKNLK
jgi:hypothetical protein